MFVNVYVVLNIWSLRWLAFCLSCVRFTSIGISCVLALFVKLPRQAQKRLALPILFMQFSWGVVVFFPNAEVGTESGCHAHRWYLAVAGHGPERVADELSVEVLRFIARRPCFPCAYAFSQTL